MGFKEAMKLWWRQNIEQAKNPYFWVFFVVIMILLNYFD